MSRIDNYKMSSDKSFYAHKIHKYKTKIYQLLNEANIDSNMTGGGKKYDNIIRNENIKVYKSFGTTNIINSDISSLLEINGSMTFKSLKSNGITVIYGSINGTNGHFHNLTVYGDVKINDCHIDNLYIVAPSVNPVVVLNNCSVKKMSIDNISKKWYPIIKNTNIKKLIVKNNSLEIKLSKSTIDNMQNATLK